MSWQSRSPNRRPCPFSLAIIPFHLVHDTRVPSRLSFEVSLTTAGSKDGHLYGFQASMRTREIMCISIKYAEGATQHVLKSLIVPSLLSIVGVNYFTGPHCQPLKLNTTDALPIPVGSHNG